MSRFGKPVPMISRTRTREKFTEPVHMTSSKRLREKFSNPARLTLLSRLRASVPVNYEDNCDSFSDDNVSSSERLRPIEIYLETLYLKRDSKRVEGLTGIVEILSTTVQTEFVQNEFATLLYRFLHCIKKGSVQELDLAANAIGLLALTNNCQDNAQEIYAESIPVLTKGINSKMKTSMILNCLAVITFFSASNCVETEETMQVIWSFIQSKFGTDLGNSKYPIELLNDAICAWSFLLASLDGWRLSYKCWQGGISYFIDLLQQSDEAVCIAAGEALALIFELGNIDKFSTPAACSGDIPDAGIANFPGKFSILKEKMSDRVLKQLEKLSKKDNWDVLKYFKDGNFPLVQKKIGKDCLNLSSWSKKIQLNFMKRFLGHAGFLAHMKENERVQKVFKFRPKVVDLSRKDLYESTPEKVVVNCFMPLARDPTGLTSKEIKVDRRRNINVISKSQTILRHKKRSLKARNNECSEDGY